MGLFEILQGGLHPGYPDSSFFTSVPLWFIIVGNIITVVVSLTFVIVVWGDPAIWIEDDDGDMGFCFIGIPIITALILVIGYLLSPVSLIIYLIIFILLLLHNRKELSDYFIEIKQKKEAKKATTNKQIIKNYKNSLL